MSSPLCNPLQPIYNAYEETVLLQEHSPAMEYFLQGILMAVLFSVLGTQMGVCGEDLGFITWDDLSVDSSVGGRSKGRVIVVSQDGSGDSRTVQGAVDMVRHGNNERVKIFISPGKYSEKVIVPKTKPYISFIGKPSSQTVISWHLKASDIDIDGNATGTYRSASVSIQASFFCASGITFENTAQEAVPGAKGMQAVALRLTGNKTVLYKCNILGSQDTLYDHKGKHFFKECYIQGSIDFIFGSAKSLYQDCTLHSIASDGAIAASKRNTSSEDAGFSFVNCTVTGSGIMYLGRAWGQYATVVYAYCQFDVTIRPEGWYDWKDSSRQRTVTFGEFQCSGRGADQSRRVPWAHRLTYNKARPYLDKNYIEGNQWLRL